MDKEFLKQNINNDIEIRKYISTYILILTGGIITLTLGEWSLFKVILLIIGAIIDTFFIYILIDLNKTIISTILKLKEE